MWTMYFVSIFLGVAAMLYLSWRTHNLKQYKHGYEVAWEAHMHSDQQLILSLTMQATYAPDHARAFYQGVKDAEKDFLETYEGLSPLTKEQIKLKKGGKK